MVRQMLCVGMLAAMATSVLAQDTPRNILWDGTFDTGYGNTFWGTTLGNLGPNRRALWKDGAIRLDQTVVSRTYWLEEGPYALCAWVKRSGTAEVAQVNLTLTNYNDADEKTRNEYVKKFDVPAGDGWHRIGFVAEIKGSHRPMFHVELSAPKGGVLVDAVSLTAGDKLPDAVLPAADIEAAFFIPEETGIYVDGEERVVEVVIANHGPETQANVQWEIFDHREQSVRKGTVSEKFPAKATVRKRIPMDGLPHDGYRLACSVEGRKVLGDALVALLPRIDADALPHYGADACITPWGRDFTLRFMRRVGMNIGNTLSPAGIIGRWGIVEPEPGQYKWQDETVDAAIKAGIEIVTFLGLKSPPKYVEPMYSRTQRDISITDEKSLTEAYCRYVDAYVRHYAGRIKIIHMEDEVGTMFETPERLAMFGRLYKAAYQTAKKAAADNKAQLLFGLNATQTGWWGKLIDIVGPDLDFVSQNTNTRPDSTADTLNLMRKKQCFPEYFFTIGVGQKSVMRKTSLSTTRSDSTGAVPGLFAWQMLTHLWMNRPYGTENRKDGPIVRYGYYDMRVLGQSVFNPNAGKTCIEYDNSPTLGLQAMAMVKYHLTGMRPVRDAAGEYSCNGAPTGNASLNAYPFRSEKKAVIALITPNGSQLADAWKLSGIDFDLYKPVNIYGQPLKIEKGVAMVVELPVFLLVPVEKLSAAVAACKGMTARAEPAPQQQRLEVGKYILDVDPDREGLIRLSVKKDGKETVILDRLLIDPWQPKPTVTVSASRMGGEVSLYYSKNCIVGIGLSENGLNLRWYSRNVEAKPLQQTVRLRVSPAGGGKGIVIQEGDKVVAGRLREDYGQLYPAEKLPAAEEIAANASRVVLADFARFDLSEPNGRGYSPANGFRWKVRDGEAFLEASYTLNAPAGAGSSGLSLIKIDATIVVP